LGVEHHVIRSTKLAQGHLLCAIGPLDADGTVAAYFKTGFPGGEIASQSGFYLHSLRSIGDGFQAVGKARIDGGEVHLPLPDTAELAVPLVAPRPELFRGLNTALSLRLNEPPEAVIDWLRFHARTQDLQAALIVDRADGGKPSDLVEVLRKKPVEGIAEIVVLSFDVPLGHPQAGDEAHAIYAPDAPGKDRMEAPAPDPWRAPFVEIVLYELLRQLYLSEARAVTNIDLSDLVYPLPEGTVFDRATAASSGIVSLIGQRIYPWGLKKGAQPTFGDHICRRFDAAPGNARWCVDPSKSGPETVWRLVRIVQPGASSPPEVLPYLRCMAMRHPDEKPARIVPKTSLVEDDRLVALMAEHFDADPRRAPEETVQPAALARGNRTGIVTCMKNEGPFILEWLAYHRAIGVEEFLVYTNDCTDGTDELLDLLQKKGVLQHRDNPYREVDMKPQHAALHAASDDAMVQAWDWVICTDVDEFINIHVGEGRLDDLYAAIGDTNMISMTWRLFGNADVERFRDGFIIEEYTRCAPHFARKPHHAWGFKTASRNTGIFKKLGVHRPKGLRPQLVDDLRWVNGSGKPMPRRDYRTAWRSTTDTYGYDLVTLNHYALRSAESFLVKRDRGRVNHVDRDQGLTYWFRMNHNAEEDRSIQRMIPAARAEFAKLMADREIEAQHSACVRAHRAKIAELMATEKYDAFFKEITSPRMRKLSRMLEHFGSAVFFNGPDVIPDAVLERAGEPGFFFTVEPRLEAE
jgi:hypothetical protein